jgi:uridine phosphorylase
VDLPFDENRKTYQEAIWTPGDATEASSCAGDKERVGELEQRLRDGASVCFPFAFPCVGGIMDTRGRSPISGGLGEPSSRAQS